MTELLKNPVLVVKFFATWCGPCKLLKPVIERLEEANTEVVFAETDADKHPAFLAECKVTSLPTVVVFKDGVEQERFVGGKLLKNYQDAIDKAKA